MNKTSIIVLIVTLAGYFSIKWIIEPSYDIVDRDTYKLENHKDINILIKEYDSLQEQEIGYKSIVNKKKGRVLLKDVSEQYVVVWTGVQALEDGLRFFVVPNLSITHLLFHRGRQVKIIPYACVL